MTVITNILQNTLSDLDKRIIEEARHAFLTYGYAGTNVDQIAQVLGIGKGTIYRHFQNKAFLFLSVVIYTYQEMRSHFAPIPTMENPEKAFHLYLTTLIQLNKTLKPFFSLLNPLEFGREFQHDCGTNPQLLTIMERFQKEKAEGLTLLASLIAKLQQQQLIKSQLDAHKIANMIFALITGYLRDETPENNSTNQSTRDLLSFIYHAIEYQSSFSKEENT
ncbi:MAG: TetR/AcrR family transcriptional regulator [Brevinematales bacterium]|nr:TetR/AcrR family transcriptional regulator [Brevinematales bacterium]